MEPRRKRLRRACAIRTDEVVESQGVQTWLDLLPTELCHKIAALLPTDVSSDPVLALAETSAFLHAAVKTVVNHRVIFSTRSLINRWYNVLGNNVRIVDIASISPCRNSLKILQLPCLQRARICDDRFSIRGITGSLSLRALTICPGNNAIGLNLKLLLYALKTLYLTSLTFDCEGFNCQGLCSPTMSAECLEPWEIGNCCPHVTVLDINCPQFPATLRWPTIAAFPALKEITLYDTLHFFPPRAYRLLASLDAVHFKRLSLQTYFLEMINKLGPRVSTLSVNRAKRRYLLLEGIKRVATCRNLTNLQISMAAQAEIGLSGICHNLRSLRLTWRKQEIVGNFRYHSNYAPEAGVILGLVKKALCLTDLHLCYVNIARDEFKGILKTVGPRLLQLGISETGHGESPVHRLAFVMEILAANNPNLKKLHVEKEQDQETRMKLNLGFEDVRKLERSFTILQHCTSLTEAESIWRLISLYSTCARSQKNSSDG